METESAIQEIARDGYSRLLAIVASRTYDLAVAEDALGDAFHAALRQWPNDGVPQSPEAWLLAVAKRRLVDEQRRKSTRDDAEPLLRAAAELDAIEATGRPDPSSVVPDERLKLLFVCTHPAIDVAARTPLMLQVVLGLDALRIASAFLVAPSALSQRLVRAKAKIRSARIPFTVPESPELADRLESVLEAIYAAYGAGWDDAVIADSPRRELTAEAIWLARVLMHLMPDEPECLGLLALLLHCEARQSARRDKQGNYIPLAEQNTSLWSRPLMTEAKTFLARASRHQRPGRFQLEAAIQSAHASRAFTGGTPWSGIVELYRKLLRIAPTIGGHVAYAGALLQSGNPQAALCELESLAGNEVTNYQPYWAAKAQTLLALGHNSEACVAAQHAAGLTQDEAVRRFLMKLVSSGASLAL
ncbi:MAG: RNA polymerase sigma-70 factor ECF subfamily [Limisphaerales bacterium]|nr:MAG: RNA polymerase sigma-70 factor ECF subfamily [Limisphaerales bacterium]TXT45684.1 MAG: RNA polymerase sigma-70 factor ECF subfamily [Limisphaerales bacterium]